MLDGRLLFLEGVDELVGLGCWLCVSEVVVVGLGGGEVVVEMVLGVHVVFV